jgi:hypothetical protein
VTFTAMVRARDVRPAAFAWIGAEDSEGRTVFMARAEKDSIVGTAEWRPITVDGWAPPGAAYVLVGVTLLGTGEVWLDDVRLVAEAERGQPRVRLVVQNAGFEE